MTTKLTIRDIIVNWLENMTYKDWSEKTSEELADELMANLKEWVELTKPKPYVKPKIITEE